MNIPEGADFSQMPTFFGFGRIKPRASFATFMRERYATVRVFGWRYFIAWGRYDGIRTTFRHWLARDAC